MQGQKGFWDFEQRLEELSREGDPLEKLAATVDFETFRPILLRPLRHGRKRRGPRGRPARAKSCQLESIFFAGGFLLVREYAPSLLNTDLGGRYAACLFN